MSKSYVLFMLIGHTASKKEDTARIPLQSGEFFHMSSGWFDCTELSLTCKSAINYAAMRLHTSGI